MELIIQSLGFLIGFQEDLISKSSSSSSSPSPSSCLARKLVASPGKPQGLAVILVHAILTHTGRTGDVFGICCANYMDCGGQL